MASPGMTSLRYMIVLGQMFVLVLGRDMGATLSPVLGAAAQAQAQERVQERVQGPTDTGYSTEEFALGNKTNIVTGQEEGRNLEITPTLYTTMFSNSLASVNAALVLLGNSTADADDNSQFNHMISIGVSTMAALCSGVGAIISVILIPLRVVNQILAIIALALLAVYVIEDKQGLKHLLGSNQYYREPAYSSNYGFFGASGLYRKELLEENDNELGLGEKEVFPHSREGEVRYENDEYSEKEQTSLFDSYSEDANSIRDLLKENNGIDEEETDAEFTFRQYSSTLARRQK